MTFTVEVANVTKKYRKTTAIKNVSFSLEENTIYGLLGRNGAGKTTVMSIITAQNFATSGDVRVFGEHPYENAKILSKMCFVRESQRYPDEWTARNAIAAASLSFPNWNTELADDLVAEFQIPLDRTIKKVSRGQLSAIGVVIGIASRAEVTFFDEPYLGLDAVARQIFYDRLLKDFTDHPRTIVLSSHLIDEVANLIERVLVIDQGQIIIDESAEDLRDRATTIVGDKDIVARFTQDREVLHQDSLGRVTSTTVLGHITVAERQQLAAEGVDLAPVSLQQLIVRLTQGAIETSAIENKEDAR